MRENYANDYTIAAHHKDDHSAVRVGPSSPDRSAWNKPYEYTSGCCSSGWPPTDRDKHGQALLTAANATGILRRERRAKRKLDPVFEKSLKETIHFWSSAAAALGIPKQRAFAPRFAPKLADIKAATAIGRLSVARNLTWDECEKLMGFPEGWTAVEGDSSVMPSLRQSLNGSDAKSSPSKRNTVPKKPRK